MTASIEQETEQLRRVLAMREPGIANTTLEAYLAGLNSVAGAVNPHAGAEDSTGILCGEQWKRGQQKARAARITGFQELLDDVAADDATDDAYRALADTDSPYAEAGDGV